MYNGNNLHSSYKDSSRIRELSHSLDPRTGLFLPKMINGTGKIYQKTLWLNAADRSLDNVKAFEKKKGKLILAFNDWHTYFDVRVNQLELRVAIKDNLGHLTRVKIPWKNILKNSWKPFL